MSNYAQITCQTNNLLLLCMDLYHFFVILDDTIMMVNIMSLLFVMLHEIYELYLTMEKLYYFLYRLINLRYMLSSLSSHLTPNDR